MTLSRINQVFAADAALPEGNQNSMKISLPGVISHGERALTEMIVNDCALRGR